MADLGIYQTQEPSDEKNITTGTQLGVPVIVVHNEIEEEQDIIDTNDEPPPYEPTAISEDPENYYESSTSIIEYNSNESYLENTFTQMNEESLSEDLTDIHGEPIEETIDENDDLLVGITLSPLERLVKFSHSKMVLQRLVVTKEISNTIHEISIEDAVKKVLPVIDILGKDTDDSVKEALAGELDKIIYFYYENAPPLLNTTSSDDATQPHIPSNAFASIVIDFLLDQNTTLASIAQQSIVTVASELADTIKDSDKYKFHQSLLHYEIYQGIILGLMEIVNSGNKIVEENHMEEDGETDLGDSNNKEMSAAISNATAAVLKHYDDGGINLAKMVCLMLISALAQVFGSDGCTEKFLPIVESMVSDPMFYVRKEAAAAVGSLSTAVNPMITLERLLPLYSKLSADSIWHVRRSCVFALPFLCEVLPDDVKVTTAVEGFELFKNDVSRNVRNSLADITGEVISKFLPEDWKETGQPGQVPEELLDFFLSLGNATPTSNQMFKLDTERIHNCAFNYPAVVLTAGVGYWDSHLKNTYLNLTKDYQLKVRRTFAYSLHDIARIIGPERTERDLVQIFALYLMDLDDVKQGVLEHLSEFLSVLATSSRNEYIPILAEVWDGVMSNWHLRDILANQLRDIARLFDASRVVEHILPLAIRACHDEFAAVRETGVEIFPVILDIVKKTVDDDGENLSQVDDETDTENELLADRQQKYALALLNHVMEKLDDLVRSSVYRTRLVFTQICRSLLELGINPADFASFFLPRLIPLSKDPVVNVRIATSRTIKTLCSITGYRQELNVIHFSEGDTATEDEEEEEMKPEQILDKILYNLATDSDGDVRHYVFDCITPERHEIYQQRKQEQDVDIATELAIAENKEDEELSALFTTLPPPPTLPAHLVTIPSTSEEDQQIYNDDQDEEISMVPDDDKPKEEDEEIYNSTESPMDIVDDYDDVEDMSLSIDQTDTNIYEDDANGDQVIPFIDTQQTDSKLEDEVMTDMDATTHHYLEEEEVAEKAQHVYLSKIPAHVVINNSLKENNNVTTITTTTSENNNTTIDNSSS